MKIRYENIEDSTENHTRFLILSKQFRNQPSGNDKTSILINLPHEPGALADFLQRFHKTGINLSKVESRPAKLGSGFEYIFYIDFEGHMDDEIVKQTLAPHMDEIKWLGSYLKVR